MKNKTNYNEILVFTIAANNYLNYVNVLGKSVKESNSELTFVVVIADKFSTEIQYENLVCDNYLFIEDIIKDEKILDNLSDKYSITEFCTTIKPDCYLFFEQKFGAKTIIYLDPDIKIFSPLIEVFDELELNDVVLTPHVCSPTQEGIDPSDHNLMKTGVYNLGFLAMNINDVTRDFLFWWKDKLYKFGQKDIARGYFYDQIWWMLGPCFLDKVKVLRHLGYNMCNWNLHERNITKVDEDIVLINDSVPLRFFHFSHFDESKFPMLAPYNSSFTLENRHDVKEIYLNYANELKNEFVQFGSIAPYFGKIAHGEKPRMSKTKKLKLIVHHLKDLIN
jgi:hypothetical protein